MLVSTATLGRMTLPRQSLFVSVFATSTTEPCGSVHPGSTSPAHAGVSVPV